MNLNASQKRDFYVHVYAKLVFTGQEATEKIQLAVVLFQCQGDFDIKSLKRACKVKSLKDIT